ncbi:pre-mRNA-splicing factor Cwc26p [[Candida] railenensis]|uniref:Pre-mRNA-splicing factor CWC26 n=1 Tax=[Candida] railenensis TaxID=45579 RepID=A0A9P0QUC4_9ASCO|nr:pre-mRNA-splicing factor Cwc26p [[Candida] railenensis]
MPSFTFPSPALVLNGAHYEKLGFQYFNSRHLDFSRSTTKHLAIMSKADYLSKYLDGGSKKKSKSKSKSKSKKDSPSIVVVEGSVGIPDEKNLEDDEDEELSDEQPVRVNSGASKPFKGFKRIDGKQIETKKDMDPSDSLVLPTQTTVYRDSTGRIIDIGQSRNELKQSKLEQEELDKKRRQQLVETDLSRIQKKQEEENLENATSFTVSKDDQQYNSRLKQENRFDDPLSTFQKSGRASASLGISLTGNPTYDKGISPANRFGITAGWFWDGIDRSNGFEELVMRKRNEVNHSKREVDDYELEDVD